MKTPQRSLPIVVLVAAMSVAFAIAARLYPRMAH